MMTNYNTEVITSNMRTFREAKADEIFTVLFRYQSNQQEIALRIQTTEIGIAVVEGYLYLKSITPACEYRAVSVEYPALDIEMIREPSNILLAHLDEDNSILVAAFISLFNTDSTATDIKEIERELKKAEESYCEQDCRNVDDVKTAYRYIWKTYLFIESTGMVDFCTVNNFKELRDSVSDPHELLFWSVLLCFWGGYDGKHPYSLFKAIIEDAYISYISFLNNKRFLHDLFLA